MKSEFQRARKAFFRSTQRTTGLIIFLICLFIYLANDRINLGSNDNIPHTLLAFNWLENHTLHFDNFRDGYLYSGGNRPYFFTEAPNGHLTSRYPIGTALVTFPLYVIFFLYLKITSLIHFITSGMPLDLLNVTNEEFSIYRKTFGKLAGAIVTALSVTIFYLTSRFKFHISIALLATFIFAFATSTLSLNSQDLRQHTVSNLVLISLIFCLMKANHTIGNRYRKLLLVAGIFCGLLPSIRITSSLFTLAIIVYVLHTYRKDIIYFGLGLSSLLLHFAWNAYYFGLGNLLNGGYVEQLQNRPNSYAFSLEQFANAFFGLLISPGEGLFIFSPVLLFSVPVIFQLWKWKYSSDERLLLYLTIACIGLLFHFSFYKSWMGGSDSYGCRFLTDTLPVLCILVAYFIAYLMRDLITRKTFCNVILLAAFLTSLLLSTTVHTVGVFTETDWGRSPIPVGIDNSRVWHLHDSQIERHIRNLFAQLANPIQDSKQYIRGLAGRVEEVGLIIQQKQIQPIGNSLVVSPQQQGLFRATLRNTGESRWFGYQTGMFAQGETKLRLFFVNSQGKQKDSRGGKWLNISGIVEPGEQTEAIGRIIFPKRPGKYQLMLVFMASGLTSAQDSSTPAYTLQVIVRS